MKTGRRKISLNILLDLSAVNSFIYLFTRQISWLCSEERWLTRLYFDTGLRFCIFGKHKNFTVTLSSVHCCRQWVLGFSILPITEKFFKYEKLECWSLKSQHWMKMKFKMCRKWFLQYNIELIKLYKSNSNSSLEASKSYWIILWYNIR